MRSHYTKTEVTTKEKYIGLCDAPFSNERYKNATELSLRRLKDRNIGYIMIHGV